MGRDSARTPQPKLLLVEDDLTDRKDLFTPAEATTEALLSYHFWGWRDASGGRGGEPVTCILPQCKWTAGDEMGLTLASWTAALGAD